jgi:hypothetical protein
MEQEKQRRFLNLFASKQRVVMLRIGSINRRIESDYGLPEGSVCLVLSTGRKARIDATVGALQRNWSKLT